MDEFWIIFVVLILIYTVTGAVYALGYEGNRYVWKLHKDSAKKRFLELNKMIYTWPWYKKKEINENQD